MKPEHWHRVDDLLSAALEREPGERASFLANECQGDEDLKKRVEFLLRAHQRAGSFLEPVNVKASRIPPERHHHIGECEECRRVLEGLDDALKEVAGSPEPGRPGEVSFQRGATLGRYVVLDRIGEGGMGVVLSAYDPELDRKVALKLLRPFAVAGEQTRARLLREAQATARLQHPNVVAIHDVGEMDGCVFAAMEFVEGVTLREWLAERPRSWREIQRAFLQAGEGLAAAHRKGLVHRDFKPDNVLVDAEGRVRVADFGLARAVGEASGTLPADAEPRSPALYAALTRTGAVLGTPAYMAPEQRRGAPADARTDQYSFCVALFEALHGQLPFKAGKVASRPVPARIRRALLKGLKEDPAQRHPSMDALLGELQRPPLLTAPRTVTAALLIAALSFAGWRLLRPVCTGAEQAWGDLWSAPRREAARAAFGPSREQFARADSALNALRAAWIAMRTDACLATRARGEQSEALLDLRVECLDDRRREADALAHLFETAAPAVAAHASEAVDKLTPLSRCADARALTSRVAPPNDADARIRVEEAKGLIARAKALLDTIQWAAALPVAVSAVDAARRAAYKPVEAEALYFYADALRRLKRNREAESLMHAAASAAIEGHDDGIAADAFNLLTWLEGFERNDHAAGELWARYARAAIARLGGDDLREAQLDFNLAHVYMNDVEHLELSLNHRRKSLELYRKAAAAETHVAWVQGYLGIGEANVGHLDEAIRLLQSAIDTRERQGREDGVLLLNLGETLLRAKRPPAALQALEHGLDILRRMGVPSPWGLHRLAWAMRANGRPQEALRLDRESLEQFEKTATGAYWLLEPLTGLGEDLIALGRPGEAIAPLDRAVQLFVDKKVNGDIAVGLAQFALARALWDSGVDRKRARALAADAQGSFRGPAEKYGSFYAGHLAEIEQWLREREGAVR